MKAKTVKLNIRKEGKGEAARWVLDYRPVGGKRIRRFFHSRSEAEREADSQRKASRQAGEGWIALTTPERNDLITGYERLKKLQISLNALIDQWENGTGNRNGNGHVDMSLEKAGEQWVAMLKARGNSPIHVDNSDRWVRRFARGREKQPVAEITRQHIVDWLAQFDRHTYNNHRDAARSFFGFCHDQKWHPEFILKGIPKMKIKYVDVSVFTVDQARSALQFIVDGSRELLGYFALATFCGIRPEELNRMDWSMVDLKEGLAHVGAGITKTNRPRIIHLHTTAIAWLRLAKEWNCPIGADFRADKYEKLTPLREHLGFKEWPHDIMRHSFGSYYTALNRDIGRTSLEMGNSADIVKKHYLKPIKPDDCKAFWSLSPEQFNL